MVPKKYFYLIAGLLWIAVSIMLLNFARIWLFDYSGQYSWVFILSGLILAALKYRFVFSRMADNNLDRIDRMKDRTAIYKIYTPGTYLLIIIMMSAGILFRRAGWPRECLASIDIAIGLGLFFASIRFFRGRRKRLSQIN